MFGALCFEGSGLDSVRFWALEFVDFPKWLAKHQMKFLSCNPSKEVSFLSMLNLISTWLGISRVSSSYSLFSHHVIAEWLPYALTFKELHILQNFWSILLGYTHMWGIFNCPRHQMPISWNICLYDSSFRLLTIIPWLKELLDKKFKFVSQPHFLLT